MLLSRVAGRIGVWVCMAMGVLRVEGRFPRVVDWRCEVLVCSDEVRYFSMISWIDSHFGLQLQRLLVENNSYLMPLEEREVGATSRWDSDCECCQYWGRGRLLKWE